jgi:ornithine decarboxylase
VSLASDTRAPTVPRLPGQRRRPVSRPPAWPDRLRPESLHALGLATPFLAVDLAVLAERIAGFVAAFDGRVGVRYAVKCNSLPGVLAAVHATGHGFEIASAAELDLVTAAGGRPADVFYSNPVKPVSHLTATAAAGVRHFVVDGPHEIDKLAAAAPGCDVIVRVRIDDASSAFPLSAKFGVDLLGAAPLLDYAASRGLVAAGITFHVGSQCHDVTAWARAVRAVTPIYTEWARRGRPLQVLDIGGGFPARYADPIPPITVIGAHTLRALDAMPAPPVQVVAEPGRGLVAEAGVIGAEIIGREDRNGRPWLFLEIGAYNGLMEAAQKDAAWPFPVLAADGRTGQTLPMTETLTMTVTGPTCDSSDTVLADVLLPASVGAGDRLYLGTTGAYTLCYASSFNGFPPPEPVLFG